MKKFSVLTIAMLCVSIFTMGQNEEFKPGGKPFMKIFTNYNATFSDGESASAFAIERFYLGYEYAFSENLSAKANFDIGDPGVGKLEMTAYVKNAYLKYKVSNLTVNFGMISTTQFKVQEGAWGYRYLEKSFQDAYKFNASADLGVSVAYKFCDAFSADFIIQNGEGYKKLEADSTFRYGLGATIEPISNLTGRVYYDFSTKETTQSSIATFIGYANDQFSISAEYMKQLNASFNEDHDLNGVSLYATVNASKKVKFFGRFDDLSSNNDWNLSKDGQLVLLGIEYAPVKGVKLAPNFRNWNPADDNKAASTSLFLNCEIKF
ncbi:porin [Sunxiuqinia sp. A32]|uniref:porin n=1 Tax=Sunxiuqinia sp. A32 TaxID=3461496 RepID=UPI0040459836